MADPVTTPQTGAAAAPANTTPAKDVQPAKRGPAKPYVVSQLPKQQPNHANGQFEAVIRAVDDSEKVVAYAGTARKCLENLREAARKKGWGPAAEEDDFGYYLEYNETAEE